MSRAIANRQWQKKRLQKNEWFKTKWRAHNQRRRRKGSNNISFEAFMKKRYRRIPVIEGAPPFLSCSVSPAAPDDSSVPAAAPDASSVPAAAPSLSTDDVAPGLSTNAAASSSGSLMVVVVLSIHIARYIKFLEFIETTEKRNGDKTREKCRHCMRKTKQKTKVDTKRKTYEKAE